MREFHYFSNEIAATFSTVWAHTVLLAIRHRMFAERLIEAYYPRTFLQLSHYSPDIYGKTRWSSTEKGNFICIILTKIVKLFVGIYLSGFKETHSSQYYADRTKLRRKYVELSLAVNVLQRVICTIKIRRAGILKPVLS